MNNTSNQDKNKKNFITNIKASFSGRKFRSGAYVSFLTAIVVIIVVVINLFVSKLDLKIDLSTQNLYSITKDSIDIVKGLEDDVTIYYMVQTGNEYPEFEEVAKKYDSLSDHIKLEAKDPLLYPKFASQYVEEEITQNSFIVVNNETGRAKYIDSNEMLVKEMDYNTYETYTTGVDVEAKMTQAIQYVVSPDLPVMYVVEGHGEVEIGEVFKTMMEKQNVQVNTLETLTQSSIPEDCDMLFINAPATDLSEGEAKIIKDYMAAGGNTIVTLNYEAGSLPNLVSILEYYGVAVVDGLVIEQDTNRYLPNYPQYLVPEIISHDITQDAKENKVLALTMVPVGIVKADNTRSSLTISSLLTTSDQAYSKVNLDAQTIAKEEGDINGPFDIGMISTDIYNNITSNLVVYSSELMFSEDVINGYGNGYLLSGTVRYLSGDSAAIPIASKSLAPQIITLSQQQSSFWGAITVFIIPLLLLGIGTVISYRRRKK
ncbi:MAG: hypothetical protein K0S76_1361 [Herbinix sp.]|nr:hypothetical protein [Herbinix sp.]